ncbi:MAG: hypothetical protein NZM40_02975 [Sphingomonadaceae bacterium]|uniref:hypothetical protein n=1 Tax=Thermaurantiacus sp. TaxID=2820283 RepID=UPI00298F0CBF|nr:hypothetical protein [Thermaurantiacus sp.]MCS6986386.1 hypothetical protein [Sphingomonadaceae bacterium]MDW8414352.1 hypothetical protein [Thermaurantiacus sp.]
MPDLARLFAPRPLGSAEGTTVRLVHALRLWVALARRHRNPRPMLRASLGLAEPAFCRFMETTVAAWPDPFAAAPPCASVLTADEATVAELFHLADADRAEAAQHLLSDMFAPDERRRLWQAARDVVRALNATA